eukprot:TRINITY_DN4518_c0_g2_i1.p1 TRINITY_DN4518_c0_g2~~TRINITY_DN4518_c0_g2_i1.p1  ORF type:complete len:578 (+),score=132.84 TRINITY_DN4518_c0_g2_i1:45-1778(+)
MAGRRAGSPQYGSYATEARTASPERREWRKRDQAPQFRPPYSTRTGRVGIAFLFALMLWRVAGGGRMQDEPQGGFVIRHRDGAVEGSVHTAGGLGTHAASSDVRQGEAPGLAATAPPLRGAASGSALQAYVVVLAHHQVDGVIALGQSLREHSPSVRDGRTALVCIAPRGKVPAYSVARAARLGWDLVEVDDLVAALPHPLLHADALNKLYAFGLTQFKKAMLLDTDMLAVASPDGALDTALPDARAVAALTSRKGAKHFQTGVVVLSPSEDAYQGLWKEACRYVAGGAREVQLLNGYFQGEHVPLEHVYSYTVPAHADSFGPAVLLHFRSAFKPWHDPADTALLAHVKDPQDATFGIPYVAWWQAYDEAHRRDVATDPAAAAGTWGPEGDGGPLDPEAHYWLYRYVDGEYTRPTVGKVAEARRVIKPGVVVVVGETGVSCETACETRARDIQAAVKGDSVEDAYRCDAGSLAHAFLNDCGVAGEAFGAEPPPKCSPNHHWTSALDIRDAAPYRDSETAAVVLNANLDPRKPARCTASAAGVRRLCPCLPEGQDPDPVPWTGSGLTIVPLPMEAMNP